jgi:hypothetical protein
MCVLFPSSFLLNYIIHWWSGLQMFTKFPSKVTDTLEEGSCYTFSVALSTTPLTQTLGPLGVARNKIDRMSILFC